jgi:hypothetical protein
MYFQNAVPRDLHVTTEPGPAMSHFAGIANDAGLYLGQGIVASAHTDYAFCLADVKS